jgi:hypothetical protein
MSIPDLPDYRHPAITALPTHSKRPQRLGPRESLIRQDTAARRYFMGKAPRREQLYYLGKDFIVRSQRSMAALREELNFFIEEVNSSRIQLNFPWTTACSRTIKFFPEGGVSPLFLTVIKRLIGNKVLP